MIENQFDLREEQKNKKGRTIAFLIVGLIILAMIIGAIFGVGKSKPSEIELKNNTITYIKKYCPILYSNTFRLDTIEYSYTDYDEYQTWTTEGYFTSESKLGLRVKSDYRVRMKYVYEDKTFHVLSVYVDGEYYYI